MSVNEFQVLEQPFADALNRRDLKSVLEMLSEDVEVFDHVPYRLDGKQLFAKHLNEAITGIVSASFGFRQSLCRVYGDTVGIVNAYDMFYASNERRQGPRPSTAELPWSSSNKASGGRL